MDANFYQETGNSVPLYVEVLKEPGRNAALVVNDECAGESDTFHGWIHSDHRHVLLSRLFDRRIILIRPERFVNNRIEDAVSFDGFGAGVRQ